jgi:hypothetical protein
MIALSDESMTTLIRLAEPLPPEDRSRFLVDVAAQLRQQPVLGDGIVTRVAADVQRRYLRPPDLSRAAGSSKYR